MKVISGFLKGRNFSYLKDQTLRPTKNLVRKGIFDTLRGWLEGKKVLDIFAGNGSLGIEAISQGADSVVFIEAQRRVAELIKQNLKILGIEDKGEVITGCVKPLLEVMPDKSFDLILTDPPYHYSGEDLKNIIRLISDKELLNPEGIFVLEQHVKSIIPDLPDWWYIWKQKKYGNTRVAFLKHKI